MAALTPEKFKVIGYTEEDANRIDRPTISYWQDAWRRLRKNPIAMGSLVVLGILLVMVIIGLRRRGIVLYAGDLQLIVAIVATAIKLIIGTVYGALMAHFGGWVDEVLMRIIEVINSIPSLLLTILIMMILGNNLFALLVALSVTAWCNTARQVRGMIKQLRETEYVYAAEVLGAKPLRIILKHYVPNMLGILILDTATAIPMFIFTEAGLSSASASRHHRSALVS